MIERSIIRHSPGGGGTKADTLLASLRIIACWAYGNGKIGQLRRIEAARTFSAAIKWLNPDSAPTLYRCCYVEGGSNSFSYFEWHGSNLLLASIQAKTTNYE